MKRLQCKCTALVKRTWPLLVFLPIFLSLGLPPSGMQAQSLIEAPPAALADRWFDMGLNPQLIDWFNQHARPTDIARVDHPSLINLLDGVTVGQKMVIFKSVADIETLMPDFADQLDVIGYNLEHGQANRPDEIADPVGSVRRARQVADQYHKILAFGPDHRFALSDGVAMAPYVDLFVLQVQRVQTEPETVRDFVLPMARALRKANPKIAISVQVRTEGDVAAIVALLNSMNDQLDGISILTSQETVAVAQELGVALRRPQPVSTPTNTPVAKVAIDDRGSGLCGGAFLPWMIPWMTVGALLLIVNHQRLMEVKN